MTERAVISVHTRPETSVRLAKLARATNRSKSFLANEALERYLAFEEEFIAAVEEGLAQAEAGEGMTTEKARATLRARLVSRSVSET